MTPELTCAVTPGAVDLTEPALSGSFRPAGARVGVCSAIHGGLMTVVVGYLATVEGRQGLTAAVEEARRRKTDLVVVVTEKAHTPAPEAVEQREVELEVLARTAQAEGVDVDVRVLGERRDVAEDLIAVAEEVSADVLVIGLRRRSPVGKLILGSNAQRILLGSPCPVLAVKPDRVVAAE